MDETFPSDGMHIVMEMATLHANCDVNQRMELLHGDRKIKSN